MQVPGKGVIAKMQGSCGELQGSPETMGIRAAIVGLVNRWAAPKTAAPPGWARPSLANAARTAPLFELHPLPYRDWSTPMRSLDITRSVQLLEAAGRGDYADIQWLYRTLERRHPILSSLITRYEAGMLALEWHIETAPAKETAARAEEQAAVLREAYSRVDNLERALLFLMLARFRGYAHLERHFDQAGETTHLEPVPQWHWLRPTPEEDWQYNPKAQGGLRAGTQIRKDNFIMREWPRPINEVALIGHVRRSLSMVDWDGFLATYGIPPVFVKGPPGVPPEKEAEYRAVGEDLASRASGYLPHGADIVTVSESLRGAPPFRDHIKASDSELMIAATGGLLTAFAEAGSGTLAGGAHMEVWQQIVAGEGQLVAMVMQEQFDAPLLAKRFPGEHPLAWFALAPRGEVDVGEVVDQTVKLAQGGYRVAAEQLSEKTGYEFEAAAAPAQPAQPAEGAAGRAPTELPPVANRDLREDVFRGLAADLAPLRKRIEAILEISDPELQMKKLAALKAELGPLYKDMAADPAETSALAGLMAEAMAKGMKAGELPNRFDPSQPRDQAGQWSGSGGGGGGGGGGGEGGGGKKLAAVKRAADGTMTMADGSALPAHAAKLGIPPAWTEVQVNPDPKGDLQAIGRDAKGRVQRIYSDSFEARNAAAKFARNRELMAKKAEVFEQNRSNLGSSDPAVREPAAVMAVVQATGIRPGSERDTKAAKQAYGATTLEGRHVVEEGGALYLRFTGKKGVALNIKVEDAGAAQILRERKQAAGASGRLFNASDAQLREYSHKLDGGGFKPKDFRTLKGTETALAEVRGQERCKTMKEYKQRVMTVAKQVAAKLGNTPAIALKAYINPLVFENIKPATA
jgi:DNA topoisomerase-1